MYFGHGAVENKKMGDLARKNMQEKVGTWEDCANKYIKLYESLLQ